MSLCVLGKPGGPAHDALTDSYACAACADKLAAVLTDIEQRCAELDDPEQLLPASNRNSGGRRTVPGPRSPAADVLLAHRDIRTRHTDLDGYGALAVLESWTRLVRGELLLNALIDGNADMHGPTCLGPCRHASCYLARSINTKAPIGQATITREVETLRHHWPWIMDQPWVDAFAVELRDLLNRLQAVRGELERSVPIGPCPGEVDAQPCGAQLRASLDGDTIRCHGRCGQTWHRSQWRILAKMIEAQEAEAG